MNNLLELLQASALLAERWREFTPDMPLKWNPRDEGSVVAAASHWLQHINEHLFPVYYDLDEAESVVDHLEILYPIVFGFDWWNYTVSSFLEASRGIEGDIRAVFFLLQVASGDAGHGEKEEQAAKKMLRSIGIKHTVSQFHLSAWLENQLEAPDHAATFPEGKELWRGCADNIRYFCNDTGHEFLDISHEQMYSGYEILIWDAETVESLTKQWADAAIVDARIVDFVEWANESDENKQRVYEVIAAGCAALAAQSVERSEVDG